MQTSSFLSFLVYQQVVFGNIANQIHGFTIDYGKFILMAIIRIITKIIIILI